MSTTPNNTLEPAGSTPAAQPERSASSTLQWSLVTEVQERGHVRVTQAVGDGSAESEGFDV
jgi:hypothetical protein